MDAERVSKATRGATTVARPVALALLLAALAAAAGARVPATGVADPPPATPVAHVPPVPLLWQVSDADSSLYLLGSFHLLKRGDYPLSSDIQLAFDAADEVVFEVAPEQLDDPTTQQRFMAAAAHDDGRTLSEVLSPELRSALDRLLAQQGGSVRQVDAYEPWFVNLSLVLGLSQSLDFRPELGLDRHLMDLAAQRGKRVAGLETFDDQLDALDASPMSEQVESLADFVEQLDEMPGKLSDLHRAWRDGNLEVLDAMTRVEMKEKTPQTYRLVNVRRNQAWLPRLQSMLDDRQEGEVMVVVGALHLLGDDGLVEQLRGRGYDVERVCSACREAGPLPAE